MLINYYKASFNQRMVCQTEKDYRITKGPSNIKPKHLYICAMPFVSSLRPPGLFPFLFRDVIFRIPVIEKILYLSFDDGPVAEITPQVLTLLRQYRAKATFFVCGRQAGENEQLLHQIIGEGHVVGNHTYNHLNGWKTDTDTYIADVEKAGTLIQSKLFRPPYGKLTIRQYLRLRKKYRIVVWDAMCMDFDQEISADACFCNIQKLARNGSVIVFHDTKKAATNMLYALEKTLMVYGKEGFRFDAIN